MKEFMLTFGSQYAREPHPYMTNAHPDGWYAVMARDEESARLLVASMIGRAWSGLYAKDEFEPEHFPLGLIGTIVAVVVPMEVTS